MILFISTFRNGAPAYACRFFKSNNDICSHTEMHRTGLWPGKGGLVGLCYSLENLPHNKPITKRYNFNGLCVSSKNFKLIS